MKLESNCNTCEFNASGVCYEHNRKIRNFYKKCSNWRPNCEYFSKLTKESPWYVREPFNASKIDYNTFIKLLKKDNENQAIDVNIFDVVKNIYGLNIDQIAKALKVSACVVDYAYNHGTVTKRLDSFSRALCIPKQYFKKCTTKDFKAIEECKNEFEKSFYYNNYIKTKNQIKYKDILLSFLAIYIPCNSSNVNQRHSILLDLTKKKFKNDLMAYVDFDQNELQINFSNMVLNRLDMAEFFKIFDSTLKYFDDIKIAIYFEKDISTITLPDNFDEKLESSLDIFDHINISKKDFIDNISYL